MADGKIHWHDTFSVWPSITVKVELAPWHWSIRWYRDDIEPYYTLNLGPVEFAFSANRGLFPLERTPAPSPAPDPLSLGAPFGLLGDVQGDRQ